MQHRHAGVRGVTPDSEATVTVPTSSIPTPDMWPRCKKNEGEGKQKKIKRFCLNFWVNAI